MKCWECKRKVSKATRIPYTDGVDEKYRDVCDDCLQLVNFNMCHFVEVERITQRQIERRENGAVRFVGYRGETRLSDRRENHGKIR